MDPAANVEEAKDDVVVLMERVRIDESTCEGLNTPMNTKVFVQGQVEVDAEDDSDTIKLEDESILPETIVIDTETGIVVDAADEAGTVELVIDEPANVETTATEPTPTEPIPAELGNDTVKDNTGNGNPSTGKAEHARRFKKKKRLRIHKTKPVHLLAEPHRAWIMMYNELLSTPESVAEKTALSAIIQLMRARGELVAKLPNIPKTELREFVIRSNVEGATPDSEPNQDMAIFLRAILQARTHLAELNPNTRLSQIMHTIVSIQRIPGIAIELFDVPTIPHLRTFANENAKNLSNDALVALLEGPDLRSPTDF
ncbi:hypothetical protein N7462_007137 [Penicillium macrosclerotiorum]|uniref:uncharacterized protein n=1 Tax=Penicillium macrosclerotiorum TaxID=303699 RepID=UPI0025466851|nr:uncharacterized protein N7462_007137 [Penicillium macrosclerotiorum]KAJ5678893.1 hypothetical protein N7462_007137 [Penicillium macrosclerotiorum]